MVVKIDLSRPPALHSELERLVREIVAATPADETDFLEWKSHLDCSTKHAHVHIARAILAFANRMPDDAARAFAGHAYLVVGAEPGEMHGVAQVDTVQLEQGIVRYVGDDGPRWRPTWLLVDGKHVLVIDVDPPQWGDPPHCARRNGDGISDGDVYVRGRGGNKPATSAHHKALQQRLLRAAQGASLDVTVSVESPSELTPLSYSSDGWIANERERLMAPLHAQRNWAGHEAEVAAGIRAARGMSQSVIGKMSQPEDRTENEYLEQVEGYLRVCEARFRRVVDVAASEALEPLVLLVRNNTPKNLPRLQLILDVPGHVAARDEDDDVEDDEAFPSPPRLWGPRPSALAASLDPSRYLMNFPSVPSLHPRSLRPRPIIDNGGSVSITFPPMDLRPHGRITLDPVVLLIAEPPGTMINASWSVTSTGADGEARGEVQLPVATRAKSLRDLEEVEA